MTAIDPNSSARPSRRAKAKAPAIVDLSLAATARKPAEATVSALEILERWNLNPKLFDEENLAWAVLAMRAKGTLAEKALTFLAEQQTNAESAGRVKVFGFHIKNYCELELDPRLYRRFVPKHPVKLNPPDLGPAILATPRNTSGPLKRELTGLPFYNLRHRELIGFNGQPSEFGWLGSVHHMGMIVRHENNHAGIISGYPISDSTFLIGQIQVNKDERLARMKLLSDFKFARVFLLNSAREYAHSLGYTDLIVQYPKNSYVVAANEARALAGEIVAYDTARASEVLEQTAQKLGAHPVEAGWHLSVR
jgi:hypothetical protein